MTFQREKQSFFTNELTNNYPLLAAFGGSSGGECFWGRSAPKPPFFHAKTSRAKLFSKAMNQDDFAKQMEKAFKDALKQADAITANAETIRKQAEVELDAAKEARRIAERTGEQMANEYYEGKRKEFVEAARTELLRDLARKHIEIGKSNHDISLWLDVEQSFVQKIREVVERVEKYRGEKPKRTPLEGSPRVFIGEDRDGSFISFDSLEGKFEMWLERGSGIGSALFGVPNPELWEAKTGIPFERREKVLTYIAEYFMDEKLGGQGSFLIGVDVVTIYGE